MDDRQCDDIHRPSRPLRRIIFFIELPEPVLLPHGSTLSRDFDIRVPELDGVPRRITDTHPASVERDEGWLYASVRFWQALVPAGSPISPAVHNVLSSVVPTASYSGPIGSTPPNAVKSVVDAVTILLPEEGDEAIRKAFERCLSVVVDYVRAYQILIGRAITPISIERTAWIVPYITATLEPPIVWDATISLLMVHPNSPDLTMSEPPEFGDDLRERLFVVLDRQTKGDPVPTFLEAMFRADRALMRDGDYQTAVIHMYLASELLFDTVLTLMLWEEGADPEASAQRVFSKRTAGRVKEHFKSRLGGKWETEGEGDIARWARMLGRLRHRVVHTGYFPTSDESWEANAVLHDVDQYVRNRLIANRNAYPRSVLLLIGRPGLERRGLWTKKMQRFLDDHADEPEWVVSYANWRSKFDPARPE